MGWMPIKSTEITPCLSKALNWISPGNDQIQNYWLKTFPATHKHITKNFNTIIEEPEKAPDWLTARIPKIKRQQGSQILPTYHILNDHNLRGNFPGWLSFVIKICIAIFPLTNELNKAECGYQVHGTERKNSHLLYMDDLKLLGRNENEFKNEMEIVHTINEDMIMKFVGQRPHWYQVLFRC